MKIKWLIFSVLLLSLSSAYSQKVKDLSKVQVVFDYHYNLGLIERGGLYNVTRSNLKMYGNSLRLYALYNLNKKIAFGAGAGLDRYENIGHNTLPLFLVCHYSPIAKIPRAYAYSDLGYAIGNSNFTKGILFDLGVGYKKMFRKHFGMNFQFGYNLKQFKGKMITTVDWPNWYYVDCSQLRHSLSFGFGFIF